MARFLNMFYGKTCAVIGMVHAQALPGTPKSFYSVQEIVDTACSEALIYKKCGADGLIVENMFDVPYVTPTDTGPEIVSLMTRVCSEVKTAVPNFPCGIQILAANNLAAIAVALASGFQFVRVEGFVYAHVADEGLIQACAGPLLRYRKAIGAEDIFILTDVKKKHSSHAVTSDINLPETAKAAEFFLSDGIILTGKETGDPPSVDDFKDVKAHTTVPLLIGSGVTAENVSKYMGADGLIVGSFFKRTGHWKCELDNERILKFVEKVEQLKQKIG